jgi:hypothetical protein
MKFKKLESGRSMVEMLGVLAIIGVLSVGGIAGYSLSMRRHRANGVVDLVSKYALIAYGQCQKDLLSGNENLSNCGYKSKGSSFDYVAFKDADVGAVPAGVVDIKWPVFSQDTNGVDIVDTEAVFSDEKLCQAVASIVGHSCTYAGAGAYSTKIKIKQN